MHINRSVLSQQHRVQRYAATSDAFGFFNQLTSPDLVDTLESSLPDHRERLFPPTETLSMFLAQALKPDRSCQNIVNDAAVKRLTHGLPQCSTKTGGYCKARQRLPLAMVSGMVRCTGNQIAAQTPDKWRWYGRRVRLVDGTTVTLADTQANQALYPQQSGQKPGLGFPICREARITKAEVEIMHRGQRVAILDRIMQRNHRLTADRRFTAHRTTKNQQKRRKISTHRDRRDYNLTA